jgi:hypothetical protein
MTPEQEELARYGLSGLALDEADKRRELAIHSSERLFRAWQASKLPIAQWIAENHSLIDYAAGS